MAKDYQAQIILANMMKDHRPHLVLHFLAATAAADLGAADSENRAPGVKNTNLRASSYGGVPDQNLKAKSKAGKFACGAYKRVRIRALAGLRLPFAGDNLAIGVLMDIEK